jgi:tRNA:m4X modification enzyme
VLGRYKADRELGRLPTCTYSRIKADIGDLVLQDVPEVAGADGSVVGVGKHLCGAATDFALRCLQAAVASGRVKARGESGAMAHFVISSRRSCLRAQRCGAGRHAPDARRRVATLDVHLSPHCLFGLVHALVRCLPGLAIATCCHHRCAWDQYCSQVRRAKIRTLCIGGDGGDSLTRS